MLELDLVHDMDGGTGGPEPYAGFLAEYSPRTPRAFTQATRPALTTPFFFAG